jgi:endoglucanase
MDYGRMAPVALAIIVLLISGASPAGARPDLHRGVNLSSWFANAPRQPLDNRDFEQIKRVGFDHVRLPFDPEHFGFKLIKGRSEGALHGGYSRLDEAIAMAVKNGLRVVLDVHPQDAFKLTIEKNSWAEDEFVAYWALIARRYKDLSDDMVVFEILNEPEYYKDNARYQKLAVRLVAQIRAENPTRWIVVGAVRGSAVDALHDLTPLDDARIIYAFHFYAPYMVSHQGIPMGFENMMLRYFRKVPYPAKLVDKGADFYAPQAASATQAQNELAEYKTENWGAERIKENIRKAKEWGEAHKAPVICGEFGVFRAIIDPESRYRWITDVRVALDESNIGWEVWDYTDGFGIVQLVGQTTKPDPRDYSIRLSNPRQGMRVIEPEAIAALGLSPVDKAAKPAE